MSGHATRNYSTRMRRTLACLMFVMSAWPLVSQEHTEDYEYRFVPGPRIVETVRHNLRMRMNGSYVGHVYRQVQSQLRLDQEYSPPNPVSYTGEVYLFEQTRRNELNVARPLDHVMEVTISIGPDGRVQAPENQIYPFRRDFPRVPTDPLSPGDSWEDYAALMVDPVGNGLYTEVPIYVRYRYIGREEYQGQLAHRIEADYALRYSQGQDRRDDRDLAAGNGGHQSSILIAADDGQILLQRTLIEEAWRYVDGTTVEYSGFSLTFSNRLQPLERETLIAEIERRVADRPRDEDSPGIEISSRPEGVAISLQDLFFRPNEAVFREGEAAKLEDIAAVLQEISDRSFLVVGHAADVGNPEGEDLLSEERARAVVAELIERGVRPGSLIFEGRGSREPIASNATEEGRRRNRRVEIIVLD